MDLNTLEKNVTLLPTPYCDFSVSDEEGNAVIFDIMESPEKTPRVYIDNDSRKEKIVPSSMCEGKTLRIYTKNLEIKRNYYINTSVELEFRDSDERLFTYGLTVKDYTLAVSFPNPNEDVKDLGIIQRTTSLFIILKWIMAIIYFVCLTETGNILTYLFFGYGTFKTT